MKGLIVKDIYCLKKQLTTYAFIIFGVVSVAVMFILSERYGNLSMAVSEMGEAGFDISSILKTSVMFFMVLPLVCTGNIADLFTYDKAASFYKTAASLPLGTEKRVLSKFITSFVFLAVGLAVDIAMAAVISAVSDIMSFSKCAGILVSLTAVMVIFLSLVITLNYAGVAPLYSTATPLAAAVIVFLIAKIKDMITALSGDDFSSMARFFRSVLNALETKFYLFAAAAALTAAACFFISVRLAKRKRGVA
jgi:hypothetical protein